MKNITKQWWFWTIVAVVGVLVFLNYQGKSVIVNITDKTDDAGSTPEVKA